MADTENCFIKSNLVIATASGWLERLVRPLSWRIRIEVSLKIDHVCASLNDLFRNRLELRSGECATCNIYGPRISRLRSNFHVVGSSARIHLKAKCDGKIVNPLGMLAELGNQDSPRNICCFDECILAPSR